jgi:sulfatase maturation enzyme AslB (radical SAM superfamily)
VGAQAYGRFLVEVFEEWALHDVGEVFVSMFDTALAHWIGMDQGGLCVHARTCGDAVALEHNGDLYSCDHYVELRLHYLCAGYRHFFRHVDGPMRVMAALLRQGRDATGLREWYAVRDARRVPGELFPCGRGRPFAQCHGATTG